MSDSSDPADEPGKALVPAAADHGAIDEHGHVPADYEWVPVLRKPRSDGWTPQRQVNFIAALADSGCVAQAAQEVGMSATSCYRLRRQSPQFADAWEAALPQAAKRLVDIAFDRAIHGSDEPVFDKDGNRVGRRMRQNDRMIMFLLRAYMPDRFRHAHQSVRGPHEEPPPALPPVAEAMRRLEPVAPPDPHLLMPPEDLEDALLVADLSDGKLPHWHRGGAGPLVEPPLDAEFERQLEAAKKQAAALPSDLDDDDEEDCDDDYEDDDYEDDVDDEDGEDEEDSEEEAGSDREGEDDDSFLG